MIALVDYGAGNLTSVRKALAAVGAEAFTPARPGELAAAHAVIVPGVGHFNATRPLDEAWRAAIRVALADGRPLLGICVGLQWLFEGSTEAPGLAGLGTFPGVCTRLPEERGQTPFPAPATAGANENGPAPGPDEKGTVPFSGGEEKGTVPFLQKVPHVGWNSLAFPRPSRLFEGVAEGAQVYFTHSYAAPIVDDTVAICDYGVPFTAAAERNRVSAVQFHPEKSGDVGLHVLRNWLRVAGE